LPSQSNPVSPTPLLARCLGRILNVPILLTFDPGSYKVCVRTSHPAVQALELQPVPNLSFASAGGTSLTCSGQADVILEIADGVRRLTRVYAIDELAVDCLLGAAVLYAEPCSYDLKSPTPWWSLGSDKFAVTTHVGSAAAVQSVRCCELTFTDKREKNKQRKRKQQSAKKKSHAASVPGPAPPSKEARLAELEREIAEILAEDPSQYAQPPPLVELLYPPPSGNSWEGAGDVDPGAHTVHASLKFFSLEDARPHVVKPKTGKAAVRYDPSLTAAERRGYEDLVAEFRDCFANNDSEIGRTGSCEMRTFTRSDDPVITGRNRRLPYAVFHEAVKEVAKLVAEGWIRESSSAWSSPIVMVKKDGDPPSMRFCLDLRGVNKVTMEDGSPVPTLKECLYRLQGCAVYSSLDLARMFHQIPLDEVSRKKTAFSLGNQHYEYEVVPFGAKNAPGAMVRFFSSHVLAGLEADPLGCYVDDLHSGSDTHVSQLAQLRKVLLRLRAHGLVLRSEKCLLGASQIKALGFVVDKDGIRPCEEKLDAIRFYPLPKNPKELRSFLGMINFNGFFVQHLQAILAPLNAATSQTPQKFHLDKACVASFHAAKEAFMDKLRLILPDFSKPFRLVTDASETGIGGFIAQLDDEDELWPIAFFSRSLKGAHSKLPARQLELYSLLHNCRHFRQFLMGKQFTHVTDHEPLKFDEDEPSKLVERWEMELMDYDYKVEYIKGVDNVVADALSRHPSSEVAVFAIKAISEAMPRAYVAAKDVPEVLARYHEGSNHASSKTMLHEMGPRFFWEHMVADIRRKAEGCEVCQRTQLKRGERLADVETDTPSAPWQSMCADLCGLDGYGDSGMMLLVADRFTRLIDAVIIPSKEAVVVEKAMTDMLFRRHGNVNEIVTDGGTEFVWLQAYSEAQGFYWKRTSRGNPRSNGLCERANLTILQMLRKNLLSAELLPSLQAERKRLPGRPLADALRDVLFVYNNRVHSATGFTPYYLAYLRDPTPPAPVTDQRPKRQINTKSQAYASAQSRARQLADVQRRALEHMTTEKRKRAERSQAKHAEGTRFALGDLVLMEAEPREKLLPGLSVPYKIIQVLAGNTYRIQPVDDFRKESLIRTHHKLVRYKPTDPTLQSPEVVTVPPAPKKRGRPPKKPTAGGGGAPAPHGSDDSPDVAEQAQLPEAADEDQQGDERLDLSSEDEDLELPSTPPAQAPMRTPRPKRGRPTSPEIDQGSPLPSATPLKQPRIPDLHSDTEMGEDFKAQGRSVESI